MCHPVLMEAQGMPACSSTQYREFQQRWADVFDQSGRKEVARAVAQYAGRLGKPGTKEDQGQLAALVEDLLFGFGLSLLATACEACPTAEAPSPANPGRFKAGTGARPRSRNSGPRA